METKVLFLFKSIDGGTGTYLETLLQLNKTTSGVILRKQILVIDKPKYRHFKAGKYICFASKKTHIQDKISILSLITLVKEFFWFKNNVNKFKPDIVISSNPHSMLISESCKFFLKLKYKTINLVQNNLHEVINYKVPAYLRLFTKYILRNIFINTNCLVTDSDGLSKGIAKEFRLPSVPKTMSGAIPRQATSHKKRNIKSIFRIISIGRLDAQKDVETLLEAFQKVAQKIKNVELLIVGDGPMKAKLETLALDLNISSQTRFLGWVQYPYKTLNNSDVFVFASKWEGFGLSLLEAMSCGVPVISSNCNYGPREILGEDKYGMLVPVGNTSKMANALINLLSNKKKRRYYAKMALKRSEYYSKEKMLINFNNLLMTVLPNQQT